MGALGILGVGFCRCSFEGKICTVQVPLSAKSNNTVAAPYDSDNKYVTALMGSGGTVLEEVLATSPGDFKE